MIFKEGGVDREGMKRFNNDERNSESRSVHYSTSNYGGIVSGNQTFVSGNYINFTD